MTGARVFSIETRYAGFRFRSRLEARWAVFFDHAGLWVPWRYEVEGLRLPDGRQYLPDFELGPFMVEVKGEDARLEHERMEAVVEAADRPLLVLGDMPRPGDKGLHVFWCVNRAPTAWRQWHWHDAGNAVIPVFYDPPMRRPEINGQLCAVAGVRVLGEDEDPRVDAAYAAARSARFEWGQNGAG